jgi:hypothetical protein
LAVFIVVKRLKSSDRKKVSSQPFRLPSIYVGRGERPDRDISFEEVSDSPSRMKRTIQKRITDRDTLIKYYIDLVESSPHEFGIDHSMTPREISSQLKYHGLEAEIADRVSLDFETSIYRYGEPQKTVLERYESDKGRISGWFSRIMGKMDKSREEEEISEGEI